MQWLLQEVLCATAAMKRLSGLHESAGGRQRRRRRPTRPLTPGPWGPSCWSSDSTETGHWCSQSRRAVAGPRRHSHSADSGTWKRDKRRCCFKDVRQTNLFFLLYFQEVYQLLWVWCLLDFYMISKCHKPKTHDPYLSCVSLDVSSLSVKSSRSSPREKWRSTSCSSSTTQLLRAFLWACLCRIFSSMVPVCWQRQLSVEHKHPRRCYHSM